MRSSSAPKSLRKLPVQPTTPNQAPVTTKSQSFSNPIQSQASAEHNVGAKVQDLCEEDKAKIAKLIDEHRQLTQQNRHLQKKVENEAALFEARMTKLRTQNEDIIKENIMLKSQMNHELLKSKKIQEQLNKIQNKEYATTSTQTSITTQKVNDNTTQTYFKSDFLEACVQTVGDDHETLSKDEEKQKANRFRSGAWGYSPSINETRHLEGFKPESGALPISRIDEFSLPIPNVNVGRKPEFSSGQGHKDDSTIKKDAADEIERHKDEKINPRSIISSAAEKIMKSERKASKAVKPPQESSELIATQKKLFQPVISLSPPKSSNWVRMLQIQSMKTRKVGDETLNTENSKSACRTLDAKSSSSDSSEEPETVLGKSSLKSFRTVRSNTSLNTTTLELDEKMGKGKDSTSTNTHYLPDSQPSSSLKSETKEESYDRSLMSILNVKSEAQIESKGKFVAQNTSIFDHNDDETSTSGSVQTTEGSGKVNTSYANPKPVTESKKSDDSFIISEVTQLTRPTSPGPISELSISTRRTQNMLTVFENQEASNGSRNPSQRERHRPSQQVSKSNLPISLDDYLSMQDEVAGNDAKSTKSEGTQSASWWEEPIDLSSSAMDGDLIPVVQRPDKQQTKTPHQKDKSGTVVTRAQSPIVDIKLALSQLEATKGHVVHPIQNNHATAGASQPKSSTENSKPNAGSIRPSNPAVHEVASLDPSFFDFVDGLGKQMFPRSR